MHRIVDDLIMLAGPFGPLGTVEGQNAIRCRLTSGDATVAAERILDAVRRCPPLPRNVALRDFEFVASELLDSLSDDQSVVDRLVIALDERPVRLVAIDALALRAKPDVATAFASLIATDATMPSLTEQETIHVVAALGAMGGQVALAAIEALRAQSGSEAVKREVEIALDTLGSNR